MRKSVFTDRNIRKDNEGGIEGLPLQLMILILIATLATAIIIGWMGNIDTPDSIGDVTVDVDSVQAVSGNGGYCTIKETFNVYVVDQDGNPLEGAIVSLSGNGIQKNNGSTAYETTDKDGKVTFNGSYNNKLKLKTSSDISYVTINVSKSGYGEDSTCKLIVIA